MKVGNIVSREFEIMQKMEGCPYVVQLLDLFYSLDTSKRIIQNTVMEYCECSLEDKLRENHESGEPMPIAEVRHFCWQLFAGLNALH
jgi:serine/threonine protein kinase